jgi:Tol biopolymer transport system component
VANADGSGARRIVTHAYAASLSPDGRKLAFRRVRDSSKADLFVVDVAGGRPRRICGVCTARWSPHEDKLIVADRVGLHLVDPSSGRRRLLVARRNLYEPSFSPRGRAVAYATSNDGVGGAYRSDIFTVRISDGAVKQLTHDGHSDTPVWGPHWIVYRRHHWAGGLAPMGRLWLMRPDGTGKRVLALGAEGRYGGGYPVFGLEPLALSDDGRRLLACQAFEFGCSRVGFTVPGGKRYGFPKLRPLERDSGAIPTDLSRDGRRILLDVGSPHDDRHHAVYEIPFVGGELRLLARNASDASWQH